MMSISSKELEKTLNRLKILLSDNYENKKCIEKLVHRRKDLYFIFEKLLELSRKVNFEKKVNKNFADIISEFEKLIKDNNGKNDLNKSLLEKIEFFVIAIRNDYKLLRDEIQTLEDINMKITRKIEKRQVKKIGVLLARGIKQKIPDLIQLTNKRENIAIIKEFYVFFIQYACTTRELLNDNLDDSKYCSALQHLQTDLLKKQPNDIEFYFEKVVSKENKGYSKEILLESFFKDQTVQIYATNNSKFFIEKFKQTFCESNFWNSKFWKKHFEYYCYILYRFNADSFVLFLTESLDPKKVKMELKTRRTLFVSELYNNGIRIYKQIEADKIDDSKKLENEKKNSDKHFIIKHFRSFFSRLRDFEFLFELRDNTINSDNASATIEIMVKIYGKFIESVDFIYDEINVKYCFNQAYLNLLDDVLISNVSNVPLFAKLIFYINTYDPACQDSKDIDFSQLKYYFEEPLNAKMQQEIAEIVDILKALVNIGTLDVRLNCALTAIKEIDKRKSEEVQDNNNWAIKTLVLKYFYETAGVSERKLFLRLSETFHIHLIKYLLPETKIVIKKLKEINSNFDCYVKESEKLNRSFDIDRDLLPGFSIPYYLSATEEINTSTDKESINMMIILFRVFTCDSDDDRMEFLKNKENYKKEFRKLKESVGNLTKFYETNNTNGVEKEYYDELQKMSFQHILDGFKDDTREMLKDRNEYARIVIDNFLNFKLEHIKTIIEKTSQVNLENSIIIKTFNEVMKRGERSLFDWVDTTRMIGDKIYFLSCYYKYSEKEFDEWFKESNKNINSKNSFQIDDVLHNIQKERSAVIEEFTNYSEIFNKVNIKHLQHNQAGALALINHHLKNSQNTNIFMNIGTGQGKSLIIAETVRKLIEKYGKDHQVFVITCYNHLAERDHRSFNDYYKKFNITSIHCLKTTPSKILANKNVIYADLDTYFNMLRNQSLRCLKESSSICFPYTKNATLILDEFDSLILDSDEIYQSLYDCDLSDRLQKYNKNDVSTKKVVKEIFDSNFIGECQKHFESIFDRWFEREEINRSENANSKIKQDGLGKTHNFARSFLVNLAEEKKAQFLYIHLDPLVFFERFNRVIGFSGSIKQEDMFKFERLFRNRSHYYEIPPFFGKSNLEKNRKFVNHPGKIITNRDQFIDAILRDVKERYKKQPILIFAESVVKENEDESDFDKIKNKLENQIKEKHLNDCKLYKISTEDEVRENLNKIGKICTITIATRIIGRGADIKVDKNIEDGLHLILTYKPKRRNIYDQMLGRTARQDEKGTYSRIIREDPEYDEVKNVVINENSKILNNITEWFYTEYQERQFNNEINIKWLFFVTMLDTYRYESERHLLNFLSSNQNLFKIHCTFEKLQKFIDECIIKKSKSLK